MLKNYVFDVGEVMAESREEAEAKLIDRGHDRYYLLTTEPVHEEIMKEAKAAGTTRAYASMKRGAREYPNGIFVSGNAPTALIAISELIREGLRPTLVVGVPVGFVNVVESKEELFALCEEHNIPAIVAFGRKGGSNVAASICNALLYSAVGTIDPLKRGWQK